MNELPKTVGEMKRLLNDYADTMPFEVEVTGKWDRMDDARIRVAKRNIGYDGATNKIISGDVLLLEVDVED